MLARPTALYAHLELLQNERLKKVSGLNEIPTHDLSNIGARLCISCQAHHSYGLFCLLSHTAWYLFQKSYDNSEKRALMYF